MPTKKTKKEITVGKDKTERLVLLDAHAIIHRAYHALPDFASSKGEPTGALYGISTMLMRIITELKPAYLVACYDLPAPTYRHEVYAGYKAGRKKTDEELVSQLERSRDIFKAFNIPMYDKAGFEADDMLGTIVEKLKDAPVDVVIASGDMDTLQLVTDKKVQVYTLKKGLNDTILYDEEKVKERYGFGPLLLPDFKGLRGDPSDNIIGIKGIGEKTATTLISEFGTIENIYKALKKNPERFKEIGITPRMIELLRAGEEEALFSKMLASIRRDAPIDFKLPEKKWRESVELPKILALFSELEFRTLGERTKQLLAPEQGSLMGAPAEAPEPQEDIDPSELKKTSIALWLINSNISSPTIEDIYEFTKTASFAKAKEILAEEIKKRNLMKVYENIELPLIAILEKAQVCGIKIDRGFLKGLSETYHVELEKLQKSIWEMASGEFNVNSPKQLGEVLFEKMGLSAKNQKKTAGGARSTRESELEKMRELHPIIAAILDYRELQKLLSTYIDTIPLLLDSNDRLHTTFVQTGASTGRMSSQNPNLQNIPIKTELGRAIRKAFIAKKGAKLVSFDYSQIELRIAAFLSGDKTLIDIFKSGRDVHTEVAARVFKVPADKVDKEMRRRAKVINFGIIYGMGVLALKQNLGTDRAEAQAFYDEYFKTFSTLAAYLDEVKAETARRGYTETFFGRRRYFEGIRSKIPYIRASAERMAINAPIQGTGADILKIAMIHIDEYLTKNDLHAKTDLLLQVHDELVYEIADEEVKEISEKIRSIMQTVMTLEETSGVPIVANAAAGESWGTMQEIK